LQRQILRQTRSRRPFGTNKLKGDDATLETIKALAKIQCTQLDAAGVLKVCEKTFINYLQSNKKAREAWDIGREEGKVELRRLQWRSAEHSVVMQIWLGKQYLGQADKQEQSGPNGGPVERCVASRPSLLIAAQRNPTNKRQ
jgi:hypothetical protein